MILTTWVLWFVITVLNGEKIHFPVDGTYQTETACLAEIPEWEVLLSEQFPDDPNLRVYCEARDLHLPTKGI